MRLGFGGNRFSNVNFYSGISGYRLHGNLIKVTYSNYYVIVRRFVHSGWTNLVSRYRTRVQLYCLSNSFFYDPADHNYCISRYVHYLLLRIKQNRQLEHHSDGITARQWLAGEDYQG